MNSDNIQKLLIIIGLLLLSAFFSCIERAFSEVNKSRLKSLSEKGSKGAKRALELSENDDSLFFAMLIGKAIVNLSLAAVSLLLFTDIFAETQLWLGVLVSIATSVIAVIVFGELLPRRFASNLPERTAVLFSSVTSFFMMILKPFTLFFGAIDVLLSKVFKSSDDRKMTQDELLDLVEEVTEEGGIDSTESELLRSAIEFTDREASDILTPRIAVEAVSDELSNEEIGKRFMESGYSRLPVYNESIDNIVGIIHQKDFFSSVMGTDNSIKAIMNKPVYIPLSMKISDILKLLQKNKSHIAIVVDEYGGTMGIVTMEDILEELVGEIWDEHDEVVEDFVKVSDNCYKILCTTDLDKMFKFFDMEDETDAATVGGWVLEKLGYFPKENESFEFKNIDISIIDADDQRVNEIMVTVKEAEASEE